MPRRSALKAQRLRWLVVSRLENAGLSAPQIAAITSYSASTIQRTLDLPAYQQWTNAAINNGVAAIDSIACNDAQEMKLAMRELVPAAIRRLERALSNKDDSVALRAITEILDRDERFSKQASSTITHSFIIPEVDLERARAIARELRPIDSTSVLEVTPHLLPEHTTETK